jgi:hypothetical protein
VGDWAHRIRRRRSRLRPEFGRGSGETAPACAGRRRALGIEVGKLECENVGLKSFEGLSVGDLGIGEGR